MDGNWSCPACTFENPPSADCCEVCESARPGSGWTCAFCTLLNPNGRASCEACGQARRPPAASPKPRAAKAKAVKRNEAWLPANHLLAYQGYTAKPKASGPRRTTNWWSAKKQDFVRGSCRLVLDSKLAKGSPASVAALTGSELWQHVWRVDMPCEASEEMPTCPICLGEPELIRTPPCGHVICYLCALRHHQASQAAACAKASLKQACKCPVCSQVMRLEDLRPVRLELQHLPKPEEGGSLVFTLVRRTGLHYLSLADDTLPRGCQPHLPQEGEPGATFARRIFGDPELYLSHLHEDLRVLESAAASGGEEAPLARSAIEALQTQLVSPGKSTQGLKDASSESSSSETLVFYQSSDGQLIFLEPYLMKQLLSEHRNWAHLPSSVTLRPLRTMRQEPLTDQMKQRHRFLAHLPSDAAGNLIAFADGKIEGDSSRPEPAPGKGGRQGRQRNRRKEPWKAKEPRSRHNSAEASSAQEEGGDAADKAASEGGLETAGRRPSDDAHQDAEDAWSDAEEPAEEEPAQEEPVEDQPVEQQSGEKEPAEGETIESAEPSGREEISVELQHLNPEAAIPENLKPSCCPAAHGLFGPKLTVSDVMLTETGPFELAAPRSEPRKGVYHFQPSTGSLQVGGEEIARFSAEAVSNLSFPSFIAERPTTSHFASCVSVVSGEIIEEIQKASNAGALFVLPSQLNGAEYPMHNYIVDQISKYKYDKTGGPRGQLAVHPAVGQFILDNAACDKRPLGLDATDVALAAAKASPSWPSGYNLHVKNGYMAVPHCPASSQGAVLTSLRSSLHRVRCLSAWGVPAVGLRPDFQDFSTASHKVHMVYASAIPVKAYLNAGNLDVGFQEEISRFIIISQYFGALRMAAAAAKPPAKQRVVLMPLGGGVFNNRSEVIAGALVTALEVLADQGVDVYSRLDVRLLAFRGSAGEQERMAKLFGSLAAPGPPGAGPAGPAGPVAVSAAAAPPTAAASASAASTATAAAFSALRSEEAPRHEEPRAEPRAEAGAEASASKAKAPAKPKKSVLDMLMGSDSQ
ncbi:unnamed protein product [Symbiodinium microadriaticum]|nr:unnamed protein product [Symbiodinium microadriaticum]